MEYPFKNLLPLDEVLEREGYYKDWTHLDPKVFYSLTQISEYIKTKGFGVDVRLLIAQLAEHFSLKTSQINEIERLFNDVMKELSEDKEFYSLPEIAGARGGFDTLGERLNDTSTQLAVERTRINNIAQLESGSTTGDVELIDGRVGHDGVTYESIGSAVRTQIGNINDVTLGMDYHYEIIDEKYLNDTGSEVSSVYHSITSFIDITNGLRLLVHVGEDNSRLCFYDADKKLIQAVPSKPYTTLTKIDVPDGAKYARITTYPNQKDLMVIKPDTVSDLTKKLIEDITGLKNIDGATSDESYEYTVTDGKYLNDTGYEVPASTHSITSFIDITNGLRLLVHVGEDNSRLCFYDADKKLIQAVPSKPYTTLTKIDVPDGARFVRVSTFTNQKDLMEIKPEPVSDISKKLIEDITGLKNSLYKFNTPSITNGKFFTRDVGLVGQQGNDTLSCVTELVEVMPNKRMRLSNLFLSGNRTVVAFDSRKVPIKALTDASMSETELIIDTGEARYIGATGKANVTPKFEYLSLVTDKDVDEFKKRNGYNTLYNQATEKPVLTIIDDDTASYQALIDYKNLCDNLGIKVTFATLTDIIENTDARIKDLLLDYERQGFTVVTHAHTQGEFFKAGADRDIVQAEADLVTGLQKMHQMGFTDYKAGWVVPFGYYDDDLKKLAIKWGFESLIRYDYQHQIEEPSKSNPMQRYQLHRYAFTDENELPTIKMLMDRAKDTNGWVIIGTHSANPLNRSPEFIQAFTDMIDYADELGFEVRTLNEEIRRRKPIYSNYEMY